MGKTSPWMTFKRLLITLKAFHLPQRPLSDGLVYMIQLNFWKRRRKSGIAPVDRAAFGAPPAPKMAMEALMQRLDRYKQDQEKAKGNPSMAGRLGGICKQYEEAINHCKA